MQHNSATFAQVKECISNISRATGTTTNGLEVDTRGFQEALVILTAGTVAATSTLDVKMQDSPDGTTGWADVTSATFVQVTPSNDEAIFVGRIKLNSYTAGTPGKFRPWIRPVGVAGGSGASIYGVTVLLLNYAQATSYDAVLANVGGTATARSLSFNFD